MKAASLPCLALCALLGWGAAHAGPYSAGTGDPTKADAPIPGFVGPDGIGAAFLRTGPSSFINERNYVNPLFFAWAGSADYAPAPEVATTWANVALTLGPVTGDHFHIAALGDLSATQITDAVPPGSITLYFTDPIRDLTGADFAVFENAFLSQNSTGGAGIGGVFAELAYVEVSTDGFTFHRFPATSLTPSAVGGYGSIDPTGVRNLAGKHVNAGGFSWGTPFDLAELPSLDPAGIHFIRLVDIPGSGAFLDTAGRPIYDSWLTTGSGGFDLEALGIISRLTTFEEWQDLHALDGDARGSDADPNANGLPNLLEYAFSRVPTRSDDTTPVVLLEKNANRLEIIFTRDERATDLTYEVQARNSLTSGAWTTIAQSATGQPFTGANGYTPAITETSASAIASIGVIRKVRVADTQTLTGHASRFLRVKVTATTP